MCNFIFCGIRYGYFHPDYAIRIFWSKCPASLEDWFQLQHTGSVAFVFRTATWLPTMIFITCPGTCHTPVNSHAFSLTHAFRGMTHIKYLRKLPSIWWLGSQSHALNNWRVGSSDVKGNTNATDRVLQLIKLCMQGIQLFLYYKYTQLVSSVISLVQVSYCPAGGQ
jgi:hypothetical protein